MAEIFVNQGHEPIFVDNESTWEPLLEWYETCPYEVRKQGNIGCGHIINSYVEKEPFVMTDPDYDLSMIPDDWDEVLLEGLERKIVIKPSF